MNNVNSSGRSDSGSGGGRSRSSTPNSYIESWSTTKSVIENIRYNIRMLELSLLGKNQRICNLNESRVRALFEKSDRGGLTSQELRERVHIEMNNIESVEQYRKYRDDVFNRGYVTALDNQINRMRASMKIRSDIIDMYNRRIQAILAEQQNAETSKSQGNSANNGNSNNNN